ncbi:ChuX/HutX family heme-like substrate-binding protein [Psychrobacter sanguinis]|uniref:Hemin-degrading factor n=1 Tax=Psychrobacter sanguinis TaxID=861445 RepID=A0A844M3H5_9GAMM|nr:ChuX/HutX family heme-like substrate-binding protein [Psychrobacter sanguinis]MUG33158.1 hemin-degrading factor [Psychrobacter sanguinis]
MSTLASADTPAPSDSQLANNTSVQKDTALWNRYVDQKAQRKLWFPLEAAKELKVSELELLLASPYSQYMGTQCTDVLQALTGFEKLESIVRNELAVHEKTGQLKNLKLSGHTGLAIDVGGLDLRFFVHKWQHMLAFTDDSKADENSPGSLSIQFFDESGAAIAKVFLRDYSPAAITQWFELIAQHTAQAEANPQNVIVNLKPAAVNEPWQYHALNDDDKAKLQQKWLGLTDIHQFYILLKKLGIDRASSYLQAPENTTYQLDPKAIESLLTLAQQQAEPIMTFVGNSGVVQIQTGVVHHVKRMGSWINILDKKHTDFTLHLNDEALAQVWCVKRPTKDGTVTCIEGFDAYGNTIVTFFGQRQEGEPEKDYWRKLTASLVEQHLLIESPATELTK